MLQIDGDKKLLLPADASNLSGEKMLERQDLQAMCVSSWEAFANELGHPNLRFVAEEVVPHPSCGDRIDLLGFDEDAGKPVVIELKRDKHKLQLLQALSYAAMIALWKPDQFRQELGSDPDETLVNSIDNLESDESPRIILIAERFDPEVILTADLLVQRHSMDIQCFQVAVDRIDTNRFLSIQSHYPPPGLDDLYRSRKPAPSTSTKQSQTWDDVKEWIEYDWGKPLIDYLRKIKDGDPNRRAFSAMFPAADRAAAYIKPQKKEVRVDIIGRRDGDLEHWSKLLPGIEVSEWGQADTVQGLMFKLSQPEDVKIFLTAVGADPSILGSGTSMDHVESITAESSPGN